VAANNNEAIASENRSEEFAASRNIIKTLCAATGEIRFYGLNGRLHRASNLNRSQVTIIESIYEGYLWNPGLWKIPDTIS
jgi:hypothetical protein